MKTLSLSIALSCFVLASFAQYGEVDSSFGNNGFGAIDFNSSNDEVRSVAIQSDDKIVVGGFTDSIGYRTFALARYNADGSIDADFNNGGRIVTVFNATSSAVAGVAIQSDGKIVAAGYVYNSVSTNFALTRYNADGTPDAAFGVDGKVITALYGMSDVATAITIQGDGKIIAAGFTLDSSLDDVALVRYNTDGTLDNSFGTDGKVITPTGDLSSFAGSVVIADDGKIIVGGIEDNGFNDDFELIRYNTNGSVDSTFGSNGIVTAQENNYSDDFVNSIALQPDGKIVAAGTSRDYYQQFELLRFQPNGDLDSSFGYMGKVGVSFNMGDDCYANSVTLQPDGKMIAAGGAYKSPDAFALIRLNSDGSPDSSFGDWGKVYTHVAGSESYGYASALQSSGEIIVAGTTYDGLYNNLSKEDFVVVRYLTGLNLGVLNLTSPDPSPLIYPNPLQQSEELTYTLSHDETLTLNLLDENGRTIRIFYANEKRAAGKHQETLNMAGLESGNYLLVLATKTHRVSVKMVKQ